MKSEISMLVASLHNLSEVFKAQMQKRLFFAIDSQSALYLDDNRPIAAKDVENVFPLALEDLSEAAKCLAFERYTAAVFHLMRSMEVAVQVLAQCLAVKNVERVWGMLLSDINTAIEALPKGDKRNEWSEISSYLYHVKQAWRNDTMHPKKTYTEAEAKHLFTAVNDFMDRLAPLARRSLSPPQGQGHD